MDPPFYGGAGATGAVLSERRECFAAVGGALPAEWSAVEGSARRCMTAALSLCPFWVS